MKAYLQNGLAEDINIIYNGDSSFYVQDFKGGYMYPNDTIKHDIDGELVKLYDTFRDLFFSDSEKYYQELYYLPIFVKQAGQDSDCSLKKKVFEKFLDDGYISKIPNLYKHLYLVDCQFLIGSIQNLLDGMEYSFTNFYVKLTDFSHMVFPDELTSGVWLELSNTSRQITSLLESYFIKAYSILDMFCKIAYEFEFKMDDFSKYNRMKSAKKLWGERKKLKINNSPKTIFEACELISIIEALRNEVVHNGSWELNPKIFTVFNEEKIIERFVLFPDIYDGHLAKSTNRTHFFGEGLKVNDVLPKIHYAFLKRVLETAKMLNMFHDVGGDGEMDTNKC